MGHHHSAGYSKVIHESQAHQYWGGDDVWFTGGAWSPFWNAGKWITHRLCLFVLGGENENHIYVTGEGDRIIPWGFSYRLLALHCATCVFGPFVLPVLGVIAVRRHGCPDSICSALARLLGIIACFVPLLAYIPLVMMYFYSCDIRQSVNDFSVSLVEIFGPICCNALLSALMCCQIVRVAADKAVTRMIWAEFLELEDRWDLPLQESEIAGAARLKAVLGLLRQIGGSMHLVGRPGDLWSRYPVFTSCFERRLLKIDEERDHANEWLNCPGLKIQVGPSCESIAIPAFLVSIIHALLPNMVRVARHGGTAIFHMDTVVKYIRIVSLITMSCCGFVVAFQFLDLRRRFVELRHKALLILYMSATGKRRESLTWVYRHLFKRVLVDVIKGADDDGGTGGARSSGGEQGEQATKIHMEPPDVLQLGRRQISTYSLMGDDLATNSFAFGGCDNQVVCYSRGSSIDADCYDASGENRRAETTSALKFAHAVLRVKVLEGNLPSALQKVAALGRKMDILQVKRFMLLRRIVRAAALSLQMELDCCLFLLGCLMMCSFLGGLAVSFTYNRFTVTALVGFVDGFLLTIVLIVMLFEIISWNRVLHDDTADVLRTWKARIDEYRWTVVRVCCKDLNDIGPERMWLDNYFASHKQQLAEEIDYVRSERPIDALGVCISQSGLNRLFVPVCISILGGVWSALIHLHWMQKRIETLKMDLIYGSDAPLEATS
eukprot:TRINITY_DN39689_c0_g1_i1.p1 TRINITY_DN39689_c0_g1~~TRINITY_DN39689_c0_g1_i1.p1  ORF type:complete len:721 (-),score=143.46 TRINITY_DN39689_c0_g1_i1:72-2234(-)